MDSTTNRVESWQVDDDSTKALLPQEGFLKDYVTYMESCTDSPLWYHVGSILTAMVFACGRRDLLVMRKDGRQHIPPLHLWSAIVGRSGERKSAATDPVERILHQVNAISMLATDGTTEAWHDRLASEDTSSVGILMRDELSSLFEQSRRSYSAGLGGWLLTTNQGGPVSRDTKSGGFVQIPRVRLSILGNIPPTVLQEKTTRGDWQSGFLPRFCFWGGRRTRIMDIPGEDPEYEVELARWLKAICWAVNAPIVMPWKATQVITAWHRAEIEEKRDEFHDDLFSSMTRLQEKAFRIAAMFAVSELEKINDDPVKVHPAHAEMALEVVKQLKRTTIGLFTLVGADRQSTEEQVVFQTIVATPGISIEEISSRCGMNRNKIRTIVQNYVQEGLVSFMDVPTKGRGRPRRGYHLI